MKNIKLDNVALSVGAESCHEIVPEAMLMPVVARPPRQQADLKTQGLGPLRTPSNDNVKPLLLDVVRNRPQPETPFPWEQNMLKHQNKQAVYTLSSIGKILLTPHR